MGSSKAPPKPVPTPPPVSSTGADAAASEADAKKKERSRFSWEKTILRPGMALGTTSAVPGTKTTLGQ